MSHKLQIFLLSGSLLASNAAWWYATRSSGHGETLPHIPAVSHRESPMPVQPKSGENRSTGQLSSVLSELDVEIRRSGLASLAKAGSSDPKSAWKNLDSITGLADKQAYVTALLKAWAATDTTGAIEACSTLPPGELRATAYATVAGVWAASAPADAAQWATGKLTGSARSMVVESVATEWAKTDPTAAARWALENASNPVGQSAIAPVMRHWANTAPEEGAGWADSLPEGSFRDSAMTSILSEWADQFPAEAAAWLDKHPKSAGMATLVASSWAESSPTDAAAWTLKFTDPVERTTALGSVLANWAASAPGEAMDWVNRLPDATLRSELTHRTFALWAADDPGKALQNASKVSVPDERHRAMDTVFSTWAGSSPDALAAWINQNTQLAAADTARRHLATVWTDAQPQNAIATASAIKDPAVREETQQAVLGDWNERDPRAVTAFLQRYPALAPLLAP